LKKILIHTCCAPCVAYVYELLSAEYDVTLYYYNPNIAPHDEYIKRYNELMGFCKKNNIPLIEGAWDNDQWTDAVQPFAHLGERSQRCWLCYEYRLEELFRTAKERGFDIVASALSISPHKDTAKINDIGTGFSEKYSIPFYEADFKKRDGFKRSLELSKLNDFYRQDYCGCVFSKKESIERKKKRSKEMV